MLLFLEEPDAHECAEVAVVAVVAQEHLRRRQRGPLGDRVHLDRGGLLVGQLGRIEGIPRDVLVHVPTDGFELLEEFGIEHADLSLRMPDFKRRQTASLRQKGSRIPNDSRAGIRIALKNLGQSVFALESLRQSATVSTMSTSRCITWIPGSLCVRSAGDPPPAQISTPAGNRARRSCSADAVCGPGMLSEKLSATTSTRCAWQAATMSSIGVCTPSDRQRQASSVIKASAINRPRLCSSPGTVVSSTRG